MMRWKGINIVIKLFIPLKMIKKICLMRVKHAIITYVLIDNNSHLKYKE